MDEQPDRRTRRIARLMKYLCRDDLGLGPQFSPPIEWAAPSDLETSASAYGEMTGRQDDPSTLKVRVSRDVSAEKAAETVAHEYRHLWQLKQGLMSPDILQAEAEKKALEDDCREYQRKALRLYEEEYRFAPWAES